MRIVSAARCALGFGPKKAIVPTFLSCTTRAVTVRTHHSRVQLRSCPARTAESPVFQHAPQFLTQMAIAALEPWSLFWT